MKTPNWIRAAGAALVTIAAAACSAEAPTNAPKPGGGGDGGGGAKPADAAKDDRAAWPKTLRVSAIPDVAPADAPKIYDPIMAYLGKELGIEVKFNAVTDYPATVSGLAAKQLDLVWYGGYTSVQAAAESKGNIERLVMRAEDKEFKSVFVSRPDAGFKSLADLKGKKFTFGSTNSTSGHLMPRIFLMQAKIDPEKDFDGGPAFQKNHDMTAQAVEAGTVDAGALNFKRWEQLVEQKKVDTSKVSVFWTSPGYVDYCWTARKDLPAGLRAALRKAFLALDPANPEHKAILDGHKASRYIAADDAMWKQVEEDARTAGLLK